MTTESKLDPSAVIDPSAVLADDVEVGPFAVIEGGVTIARGCRVAAHAIIRRFSVLDEDVVVDSFAVVGGLPQDLSFDEATESGVRIGKGSVLREGVTIHRASEAGRSTSIGLQCLLMANAHVAHDCQLGDGVILANNAMLAGHVHVGSGSFLGGGCGIHQYVTIGELAMIAGNASVTYDVPSYVTVAERSTVTGLNLLGLKRKLTPESIADLRQCYKAVYFQPGNPAKLAAAGEAKSAAGANFLACFEKSRRGRFSRSRAQNG
ncbi:MAG: acyl-ACP--UDP-N-acetylglucosamine O-acyltransferase [Opitutales bacterium]